MFPFLLLALASIPCNNATPKRGQAYTRLYVEAGAVLPVLLPIVVPCSAWGETLFQKSEECLSPHGYGDVALRPSADLP